MLLHLLINKKKKSLKERYDSLPCVLITGFDKNS